MAHAVAAEGAVEVSAEAADAVGQAVDEGSGHSSLGWRRLHT